MEAEMLKGHLDAIVLAALEAGPAHGYAIIEAINSRSSSTFDLPEGTAYPALHRLEQPRLRARRRAAAVAGRAAAGCQTPGGAKSRAGGEANGTVGARRGERDDPPYLDRAAGDGARHLHRHAAAGHVAERLRRQAVGAGPAGRPL